MEISNSKRRVGLAFTILLGTVLLMASCSSDESQEFIHKDSNAITLSGGETLVLSDTTTYELEFDEVFADEPISNCQDCFSAQTRASSDSYRAYGYDSEEPESDWRKYSLGSSWSQYGISSGIYIARYVKVHKNLSIQPNKTVVVGNYNSANAPVDAMGWYGNTKNIGFSATPTSDFIADGVTRVFYINCNLSGISVNKYIPAKPTNFIWAYKLTDPEDIW